MTEEERLEAIKQIFDIGWACRLSPCYAEWLSKILRKQYWKLSVLPFVNKRLFTEEIKEQDFPLTHYDCGYTEQRVSGTYYFRHGVMKSGSHSNLHQAIHCLNKYRGIPFEKINIEQWFCGYKVDVLGEVNPEKYIVVELGQLSSYGKLWLIYDPLVKEFWFDGTGEGKYFYSLRANGELPIEESLHEHMFGFFVKKCSQNLGQFWNCSTYSREISRLCNYARKSVPERKGLTEQ
jgi:hypothetical protein